MSRCLALVVLLSGCATTFESSKPYTRERYLGGFSGFGGDTAESVLTIYNPLTVPARIGIECLNEDPPDYPQDYFEALVEARSELNVLFQKTDYYRSIEVCHVTGWAELL